METSSEKNYYYFLVCLVALPILAKYPLFLFIAICGVATTIIAPIAIKAILSAQKEIVQLKRN